MNHRTKKRFRRVGGLSLYLCMVLSCLPGTAFAVTEDGLCEHHPEHTEECGYVAAVEAQPCTHIHTDDCYFAVSCIHEHDEDCKENCTHICSEESGCITVKHNCRHSHDESCGYSDGTSASACTHACGEECTEGCVHEHDETCGYAEEVDATPCNHVCTVDEGCYELVCSHAMAGQHDETCGYVEGKEELPCGFVCEVCSAIQEEPQEELPEDNQPNPDEPQREPAPGNLVSDTGDEPDIASVSITWGDMIFTYSDGTWNTETYVYDGKGWTAKGNTVTVENTGNVNFTASVAYQNLSDYDFIATWDKETASVPASSDPITFTLNLSGKPSKALNGETVGEVTVRIDQSYQKGANS